MKSTRIVIADDHDLFVDGLVSCLQNCSRPNFSPRISGSASTGSSLMKLLERIKADVILLDLNLPDEDGINLIKPIKKEYPGTRIIAITMYEDSKFIRAAFKEGVDGYILKTSAFNELIEAIEMVCRGETYMGNGLMIFPKSKKVNIPAPHKELYDDNFLIRHNLTKREIEILTLISQAHTNKEIALNLYISPETVSVHRKNIMRKLGVNNSASLIKFALDHSLV